jgi:sugar O-acyltransferase (sialic acid O-acetyltransferase NeuD family)
MSSVHYTGSAEQLTTKLVLVAAGGLAREVLATIHAAGVGEVVAILDDNPALHGRTIAGAPVAGLNRQTVQETKANFVVCAGSGSTRAKLVERLCYLGVSPDRFASVIHPTSNLPTTCRLGMGAVILAQVVMTTDVTLGDHVVVMPHAVLTHDVVVEDYATLCAGVVLGGGVHVGRASYLGMNASVLPNVKVGADAILGMGAVILQDVPDGQTWVGVPARESSQSAGPNVPLGRMTNTKFG